MSDLKTTTCSSWKLGWVVRVRRVSKKLVFVDIRHDTRNNNINPQTELTILNTHQIPNEEDLLSLPKIDMIAKKGTCETMPNCRQACPGDLIKVLIVKQEQYRPKTR